MTGNLFTPSVLPPQAEQIAIFLRFLLPQSPPDMLQEVRFARSFRRTFGDFEQDVEVVGHQAVGENPQTPKSLQPPHHAVNDMERGGIEIVNLLTDTRQSREVVDFKESAARLAEDQKRKKVVGGGPTPTK